MADGFQAEAFLTEVLKTDVREHRGDELIVSCLVMDHEHDDMEPGAALNSEKLLYNCFKCGSAGTLLWLTEQVLEISSGEARRLIEGKFLETTKSPQAFLHELEASWNKDATRTMPSYNIKMVQPWLCYSKYLDDRGISHEVQKEMLTGVIKDNTDVIGGQLIQQPRIVFPHFFGGKLRGWSMRKLDERQLGTKYKHTGEFPKRFTLYNWDRAVKFDSVIVVESPMSVLWLKTCGIDNVVATFGAEINPEQCDLLAKFREVTFFPDGDRAGYRGLRRQMKHVEVGAVDVLTPRSDVFIVDHSRDGWNDKDAGPSTAGKVNYSANEIRDLLEKRTPAYLWDWREDGVQEVHDDSARRNKAS